MRLKHEIKELEKIESRYQNAELSIFPSFGEIKTDNPRISFIPHPIDYWRANQYQNGNGKDTWTFQEKSRLRAELRKVETTLSITHLYKKLGSHRSGVGVVVEDDKSSKIPKAARASSIKGHAVTEGVPKKMRR